MLIAVSPPRDDFTRFPEYCLERVGLTFLPYDKRILKLSVTVNTFSGINLNRA